MCIGDLIRFQMNDPKYKEEKYGDSSKKWEYTKRRMKLRENIYNIRRSDRLNTASELELIHLINREIDRLLDEEIGYKI